jgi:enoyl-CoA hydratase/carnithine racemase
MSEGTVGKQRPEGELVHRDDEDGIAVLTLDSPENRNALSERLTTDLLSHLAGASSDESVRGILIRSSGRVFCSGADLKAAASGDMHAGARAIVEIQRVIASAPVPVVVRLDGPVRAGGLGIVAAADIALCADDVTFALTEVKLGLAAAVISLTVLHRLTPRSAPDLLLTGRTFGAAEAQASGLVTRSVPSAELDEAVDAVLAELRTSSRQGLREAKKLLNAGLVADIEARGEDLVQLSARLFGSDEAREAMLAFFSRTR